MSANLVAISRDLEKAIAKLRFGAPVALVYDPLAYAWAPHAAYLERYGARAPREAVFLGMNPGPFGMAQTGVPFGDVAMVRDFLGITGAVGKPRREHPSRPIDGFACARSEVSGTRFWGWARDRFGTAERFFDRFFVANWCPLVFMEESGRNLTPDKLPADQLGESSAIRIGSILHPSPASPAANRDWPGQVSKQLAALGIAVT
jgi:single-strand selective monofunctional uracil DNA glycosylase